MTSHVISLNILHAVILCSDDEHSATIHFFLILHIQVHVTLQDYVEMVCIKYHQKHVILPLKGLHQ